MDSDKSVAGDLSKLALKKLEHLMRSKLSNTAQPPPAAAPYEQQARPFPPAESFHAQPAHAYPQPPPPPPHPPAYHPHQQYYDYYPPHQHQPFAQHFPPQPPHQQHGGFYQQGATFGNVSAPGSAHHFGPQPHAQQQPWTAPGPHHAPPPPPYDPSHAYAADARPVGGIPASNVPQGYPQPQPSPGDGFAPPAPNGPGAHNLSHVSTAGSVNVNPAEPTPPGYPRPQPSASGSFVPPPSAASSVRPPDGGSIGGNSATVAPPGYPRVQPPASGSSASSPPAVTSVRPSDGGSTGGNSATEATPGYPSFKPSASGSSAPPPPAASIVHPLDGGSVGGNYATVTPPGYTHPEPSTSNGCVPNAPAASIAQSLPHPLDAGSANALSAVPAPPGYPHSEHQFSTVGSAPLSSSTNSEVCTPGQLAHHLGGMSLSGGVPHPMNVSASPASFGAKLCKGWDPILNQELLMQVNTRPHSARVTLGDTAVVEARKGLSRVLRPGDEADLELFAQQLKNTDASACEPDFRGIKDKVACFAVSYVHTKEPVGRFKFTREQWNNFKAACAEISDCGVKEMRVWLDQCLWLRDASQGAWAHTGLMPYVLWPVISLGVKAEGGERTLETFERMWPFVEEVAGLWSMGVIITSELRGNTPTAGSRRWLSLQLRHRCEPEESMMLILLNIFHGAVDDLHTGWTEDVEELKEMARWNFITDTKEVIVGSDWRSRIASLSPKSSYSLVSDLELPHECKFLPNTVNMYVDGSRKLQKEGPWDGLLEWMSGNEVVNDGYSKWFQGSLTKVNVITDEGEFQILGHGGYTSKVWLLVAMDGRSSRFSRGHVAWTKVMHGALTCKLSIAVGEMKQHVIEDVLQEQLGTRVRIASIAKTDGPIQWT